MRHSWAKLCGLALLVSASGAVAADGELKAGKIFPPGEPIEYPKPATNPSPPQLTTASAGETGPIRTPQKQFLPGAYVSPWLMDILKLAQAGIDPSVIGNFLDSAGTFNLTAEQIIYVRDL